MTWNVLLDLPSAAGEVVDLIETLHVALFPLSKVVFGVLPRLEVLIVLLTHRFDATGRDVSAQAQEQRVAFW